MFLITSFVLVSRDGMSVGELHTGDNLAKFQKLILVVVISHLLLYTDYSWVLLSSTRFSAL